MNSKLVAVVDYGSGNLRSVSQAVEHVAARSGHTVCLTQDPAVVMDADRIVLPGQGHMADCMRELQSSGLKAAVLHAAANKPMLGVCVGMQMLLDRSEEGPCDGLGLMAGEVKRFDVGRLKPDGLRRIRNGRTWCRV
jgi:glutamine amidotransferase